MNKLIVIISLLLLATLLTGVAAYNSLTDAKVTTYCGHYKLDKGIHYLQNEDGLQRLFLAPPEALDSMGIALEPNDSLCVDALPLKYGLLVISIIQNENSYLLRDYEKIQNSYKELSSVHVNPEDCIGCKMCVYPCPVKAITMVKGKAVIDAEICVSCGICTDGVAKYKGCPVGAISK